MAVSTLTDLKALGTGEGATVLTEAGKQGLFIWTLGNYTGQADDIDVVAANSVPLATGAWVRQSADNVSYHRRTVAAKLDEVVSVRDKGAVNDGFPNAVNHLAFEAALAAVAAPGNEFFAGSVSVAPGTYRLTAPINLPQTFAKLHANEDAVIWGASGQHVLSADGPSFVNANLTGLHLYGGLDAIHAATPGEIATNRLTNVIATQFTGSGFYFQGGLTSCQITSPFIDGSASISGCGIISDGGINNDNAIVDANIVACPGPAVKVLGLTQLLDCRRVRIEQGGKAGIAQYHLEAPLAVRVSGWSEASHEYLLKTFNGNADDMAYTVLFDGLMSIGSNYAGSDEFIPSKFDTGSKRIVFGCNVWALPTQAPARAFIYGVNENLRTENSLVYTRDVMGVQDVTLPQRRFTTAGQLTFSLCTLTRPSSANISENAQLCTIDAQMDLKGYSATGVPGYGAVHWRVGISAIGDTINNPDIYIDPDTLDQLSSLGISITLAAFNKTATTIQLQISITGLNVTLANYLATEMRIRSTAYDPSSRFIVTFP